MPLLLVVVVGAGAAEQVADTRFSHRRGIYEGPIELAITTATLGATIRYTIDGLPPTPTSGTVYDRPIPVAENATVRAIAVKDGMAPTNVDVHTYLFPSTFADRDEFRSQTVAHEDFRPGFLALPSIVLNDDDNSDSYERDVEERTSLEILYPGDPERNVQVWCGAEQGKRDVLFNLKFKRTFGPGSFRHDLFASAPHHADLAADTFDSLRLRRGGNERTIGTPGTDTGTSTMMRDQWARHSQIAVSGQGSHGTYVHLWFGQTYQGLYLVHETPDANFAANYFGGAEEHYRSIKWDGVRPLEDQYTIGSQFLDYVIVNMYCGMGDWSNANSAGIWRENRVQDLRYFVWDGEHAWGQRWNEWPRVDGASRSSFHWDVFTDNVYDGSDADLKQLFVDRVYRHLFNQGALTEANAQARWRDLADHLHEAAMVQIAFQEDRDPSAVRQAWLDEVALVESRMNGAVDRFISGLRELGEYPEVDPPSCSVGGSILQQTAVTVDRGARLNLDNPNQGGRGSILYTIDGSDPRSPGGAVAASASDAGDGASLSFDHTAVLRARIKDGEEWSALHELEVAVRGGTAHFADLKITEIMYHPRPAGAEPDVIDGDEFEFIEFKNTGGDPIDLTGVRIIAGTRYTFPPGTVLEPGAFLVLARDPLRFEQRYGFAPFDGFTYIRALGNDGDEIVISDAAGTATTRVAYGDDGPWPLAADGAGYSLVPVTTDPSSNSSVAAQWRASTAIGGSPGEDDAEAPAVAGILITEILTNTPPPLKDSVELHNPLGHSVDVTGWFLTDDAAVPDQWRLPALTIPAGSYLVLDEDDFGSVFKLGSRGGEVYLFSPDLRYSDGFSYDGSREGQTFGRYVSHADPLRVDYPIMDGETLGADNGPPLVSPLVITEIMYNARAGEPEYLELQNISGGSLDLFNAAGDPWVIGGIAFTFPPGTTLAEDEVILLVSAATGVAGFRSFYDISADMSIFAFDGNLDSSGERLRVRASDERAPSGEEAGAFGLVTVDMVRYDDGTHGDAVFPTSADGDGHSLHRLSLTTYGNRPDNWTAGPPSPGSVDARGIVRRSISITASGSGLGVVEAHLGAERHLVPATFVEIPAHTTSTIAFTEVDQADG